MVVGLAWITDPHLDRVPRPVVRNAFRALRDDPEVLGVLITGDISNGETASYLREVRRHLGNKPLFLVLGNHDFYGRWIGEVEEEIRGLPDPRTSWLTETIPVDLGGGACLVGGESWWDWGYASELASWTLLEDIVMFGDNYSIRDLKNLTRPEKKEHFQLLSRVSALRISQKVERAIREGFREVWVACHVPPFRESLPSHWREVWVNHFCSRELGDELLHLHERFAHVKIRVLAGHSHRPTSTEVQGISVRVGPAKTGKFLGTFLPL